jgi:hypothetical protein
VSELPKISVDYSKVDPKFELIASLSDVYEIEPSMRVREGTLFIGADGDYRCKLEVIKMLPGGKMRLAMHPDTWRQKISAHDPA